MKIKHRALALILSAIMVLTFMPALAFADGEWQATAYESEVTLDEEGEARLTVDMEYGGYSEADFAYSWMDAAEADEPFASGTEPSVLVYSPGEYSCIVYRFENGNVAESQTVPFTVLPRKEHSFAGDEYDGGTIVAGDTKNVVIEKDYDYFSFEFVPKVTGTYNFRAEGNKDTVGRILDKNGAVLESEDDTYNRNFSINFEAEAGKTYYLQACIYTYEQDQEDYDPEAFVGEISVKLQSGEFYNYVMQNNMEFYIINDSEAYVVGAELKGNVVIPDKVTFLDGKTRKVTRLDNFSDNTGMTGITIPSSVYLIEGSALVNSGMKSITIPETVKDIGSFAVGYNRRWTEYDDAVYTPVAGFTIFGKTGSAAEAYAKENKFTFRDLDAEAAAAAKEKAAAAKAAEEARQGTPDKSLPKMKIKKPAAKKTSITVKWTKLNKKQLKKSKATHYEIWVSESSSYPAGATTKEKIVKKSKSSWTCKGLKKNKKYFVRVRAIKYVGGVKHVGKWKQKTIKTKK